MGGSPLLRIPPRPLWFKLFAPAKTAPALFSPLRIIRVLRVIRGSKSRLCPAGALTFPLGSFPLGSLPFAARFVSLDTELKLDFQTVLNQLAAEGRKQGFEIVLVGGWALNAYGVARQTVDIDFVSREDDLQRLEKVLTGFGYARVFRSELFAKFRSEAEGLFDIDLLFIEPETLRGLLAEAKETSIGEAIFKVPSLQHLIAMKLHALKHNPSKRLRKDLADIVSLIEMNNLDVREESFRALCLKYGNADLYEMLLKEVAQ